MGININNLDTSSLLKNESVSDNLQELSIEELRITGGTHFVPVGVPVRVPVGVPVGVGFPISPSPVGFGGNININVDANANANADANNENTNTNTNTNSDTDTKPSFHHNP